MKNLRFIFIFIFFCGMVFTVFQYIPILEEETPGHRVEMAKKIKQSGDLDGDGDNSDEDDSNDDDSEHDLNYFCSTLYTAYFTNRQIHFTPGNNLYKYLLEQKFTPPPKA